MVDVETLGVMPTSALFSIGAVIFDINTGEIFEEFYTLINPCYADNNPIFSHSASTIGWWCGQTSQASAELTKAINDGEHWHIALKNFAMFVEQSETVSYWAKGQLDFPIINYHLANVSLKPLDYRKLRDMRTSLDEAKIDTKNYSNIGTQHNALDDCKFQITCLIDAWKLVRANAKQDSAIFPFNPI